MIAPYEQVLADIEAVIAAETEVDEILRRSVDLLHDRFGAYSWVGIYFVEGDELSSALARPQPPTTSASRSARASAAPPRPAAAPRSSTT